MATFFSHTKVHPDEIEQVEGLGIRLYERGEEMVFGLACLFLKTTLDTDTRQEFFSGTCF